jgi:hypothetical protein
MKLGLESLEDRSYLSVTFDPAVTYGVGSNPVFHEIGDFNADGNADLPSRITAKTPSASCWDTPMARSIRPRLIP